MVLTDFLKFSKGSCQSDAMACNRDLSNYTENSYNEIKQQCRALPFLAVWPTKPPHFRVAGMSLDNANRAALNISRGPPTLAFKIIPSQRSIRSSTNGCRKELMCSFGSLGPGIIPTTIKFSGLKRSSRGRFITTM